MASSWFCETSLGSLCPEDTTYTVMVTITEKYLRDHCTSRGGFTAKQLMIIGVEWPPPKRWKKTIVGKVLTDEQAFQFSEARYSKRNSDGKSGKLKKTRSKK